MEPAQWVGVVEARGWTRVQAVKAVSEWKEPVYPRLQCLLKDLSPAVGFELAVGPNSASIGACMVSLNK